MNLAAWYAAAQSHLLQSTLVLLLAWLLVATVFRSARPAVRYALWFVASAKFLVPFSTLVAFGRLLPWLDLPRAIPQPVDVTIDQIVNRLPTTVVTSSRHVTAAAAPPSVLPWIAAIWIAGVVFFALRWWRGWRDVRAAARQSMPLLESSGIPVRSLPAAYDRSWEPGVFGLVRPTVLVPAAIRDRLTPEQFGSVLEHECSHVERRDNLTATIHQFVETVFWFHPLVWWVGRRLHEERERACDEAVIARGADPLVYAEALLGVCRYYVESPLLSVSGVTGAALRERVEAILAGRLSNALSGGQRLLLTAIGLAMLVVPMTLGVNISFAGAQIAAAFSGLQTSAARSFDVASIKPNNSGDQGWKLGAPQRGNESIVNLELRKIIASSFRIQDKMVVGGPGWLDTAKYDITAKAGTEVSDVVVWEMMRSLLAERFHLKYHLEKREMPVYALSIARGGHKLGDPAQGRCGDAIKAGRPCGAIRFPPFGVAIDNMPVTALTAVLARRLQDRPVVDDTGLAALYDATVLWMPEDVKPEELASIPPDARPPDVGMFDAFEQQAGLKLAALRRDIQVVAIDSVQPPDPD